MSKPLVLYHFFEKDESYLDNLSHFLAFGYSEDIDYIFTLASKPSIELPSAKNITYLQVENRNYDFGGFATALKSVKNLRSYNAVIFINCSVRGPFMPDYLDIKLWTEPFINGLAGNVGLFGATICSPKPNHRYFDQSAKSQVHVQSFAYCIERSIVEQLLKSGFYDLDNELTRAEVILNYEIGLSQEVLKLGKNISCLVPEYQQNYLEVTTVDNPASVDGDPYKRHQTFGRTLHPFETVFAKVNRGQSITELDLLTSSLFAGAHELPLLDSEAVKAYKSKIEASVAKQISEAKTTPAKSKISVFRRIARRGKNLLKR